ncbi:hypothetical protein [Thermotoga neapolitana]|uniref:Uncharacterized protein n=1 Tax=Thermotoga neapolitana (strain ATCC 49049 / DSM 4359 / NBRC 107923 / NS-E) TaxID=309803 RepID=B9KBR6_THENN|nr:hypothetical protein [Thermotoga neapolitana]ACM22462.1 Putative uncharacterized protein [Thermotoga neapolitana DSM 4359]KFZ22110.1 hypothetical protein LA10_01332 [Thermotoga neapolitana LA10]MDK2949905.1 hypothetical protein [Thermotoga sp.]HBF11287.1 hypothetical protein [Thermotoga neapolitana]
MRIISDLFFFTGFGTLFVSIVFFDLGTRAIKKKQPRKKKFYDKRGWQFLTASLASFAVSIILALFGRG